MPSTVTTTSVRDQPIFTTPSGVAVAATPRVSDHLLIQCRMRRSAALFRPEQQRSNKNAFSEIFMSVAPCVNSNTAMGNAAVQIFPADWVKRQVNQ
jgi:hypothetical protein